jgi:hypothetical protein
MIVLSDQQADNIERRLESKRLTVLAGFIASFEIDRSIELVAEYQGPKERVF